MRSLDPVRQGLFNFSFFCSLSSSSLSFGLFSLLELWFACAVALSGVRTSTREVLLAPESPVLDPSRPPAVPQPPPRPPRTVFFFELHWSTIAAQQLSWGSLGYIPDTSRVAGPFLFATAKGVTVWDRKVTFEDSKRFTVSRVTSELLWLLSQKNALFLLVA